MSDKSGTSAQAIKLPTGGGALSGIGETFTPDLCTGTGRFTVPIAVPAGRRGLHPSLDLSYGTGEGNGPFGLGWSVAVPSISRRTAKGVPRYGEADTFVLSGSEELVRVGEPERGVTRYRPRTEGLFARIDHRTGGRDDWRVATRDGLESTYGGAETAVVADPADGSKIFRWMLTETTDPFGNRIVYDYSRDSGVNGLHHWDQLYLERIRYVDVDDDRFVVSVRFVYEDRPDSFSDHRAGFEVRTRRRCRRIEIRTHTDADRLSRTYDLSYVDDLVRAGNRPPADLAANGVSLLARITVVGHDGSATQALPPIELAYTRFEPVGARFQPLRVEGGSLPPASLADDELETVSAFGNGLPDLVHVDGSVLCWRNLGGGRFAAPQQLADVPSGVRLADPGVQFADMDGDGRADLLTLDRQGYFPLMRGGRWSPQRFVEYPTAPSVELGEDDIRLVDLDGDGVVDALRTGTQFELYFNDARAGWDRVETVPRRPLAEFPDVSFDDPRVKLADLDGDGLQDIVLVDERRIDYWPALGHGRWGPRVTMRDTPRLDEASGGFDPARVLLGDLDGDGVDDLVLVGPGRVTVWINQGGARWGPATVLTGAPPLPAIDAVRVTDVLASGTHGILWTSDPVTGPDHYQFLDLAGGTKPYLLSSVDNGLGAVTRMSYAPSTRFYLDDEARPATRWVAPLPFPVHVVEQVEVVDQISGGTLTNRFTYHDGSWDGIEREFRGFGMVEQFDTATSNDPARPASTPLVTRTWFHTGSTAEAGDAESEPVPAPGAWPEDPPVLRHQAAIDDFLTTLPATQRRDALRALRRSVLRTELYALDDGPRVGRPFMVTEHAYALRQEDSADGERPVFLPHKVAERTSQWERGTDPMTSFTFVDDHDAFGQPGRTTTLAVPRGRDATRRAERPTSYLGTTTITTYAASGEARYIADRVSSITTCDVRNDGRPTVFELHDAVRRDAADCPVVGATRTYFDGPAFEGLPFRQLGPHGATVRSEHLVLTDEVLSAAYADNGEGHVPPYLAADEPAWTSEYPEEFRNLMPTRGGYSSSTGDDGRHAGLWAQEDRRRYDVHDAAGGRGLVVAEQDPLGAVTTVGYDRFGLLPVRITDAAGLSVLAEYDGRTLQPRLVTDPNGNRKAFAYTPLGLLASKAVMGRAGDAIGDSPDVPSTRYDYDFTPPAVAGRPSPISVRTIRRLRHAAEGAGDEVLETVELSDGFGRLIQTRASAVDVRFGDPRSGDGIVPPAQDDPTSANHIEGQRNTDRNNPNVLVSGWQVYDDKGRVVETYEPFFSTGWRFEPEAEARLGARLTTAYDPRGRAVRHVLADGSEERTVHGIPDRLDDPDSFVPTSWERYAYGQNDNAGRTRGDAARTYAHHWDTPTSHELDALGRVVTSVERTRASVETDPRAVVTQVTHDIRGNVTSHRDAAGRMARRYVYDLANRPLLVADIDSGVSRNVLDAAGRLREERDGKGAVVLHAHDVLDRPSRQWARDRAGGEITLRQRLRYGDEADPHRTTEIRAMARAVNALGRLVQHDDEAGQLRIEAYDFKGRQVEEVRLALADDAGPGGPLDPVELRTTTRYDVLDRVVERRLPTGGEGRRRVLELGYSRSGAVDRVLVDGDVIVERIVRDAKGQPALQVLGNGIMTRAAYDPATFDLVRLRSEPVDRDAGGLVLRPSGRPLQDFAYAYDLAGNVLTIVDRTPGSGVAGHPEAGTIEDPVLRALVARGDALVRRFTYDPLERLRSATGRTCAEPASGPPWADPRRCGFGSGRHGTADQDNAPSLTVPYREEYVNDDVGNLVRLAHRGSADAVRRYRFAEGSNRITTLDAGSTRVAYEHDACGNLVRESTSRRFEWDHADRLVGFAVVAGSSMPSVSTTYRYDAAGNRIQKLVRRQNGTVESTVYAGGGFELHRVTAPGVPDRVSSYVHVTDGAARLCTLRDGEPRADDQGPAVQYALADHLGSVTIVVDDAGRFVNREELTPWGETTFGSFARKRYRFNGKERDEESGLSYFGARYYAPWLARWTSADPAGPVDGSNLYRFARGNPLRFTDPDGTQSQDEHERATGTDPPADEEPSRGPQTAGSGAVGLHDGVHRSGYQKQIKATSRAAVEAVDAARRNGDAAAAMRIAREAVEQRDAVRAATQRRLTPGGRMLSEALEKPMRFEQRLARAAQKVAKPGQEASAFDVAQELARSSGSSRGSLKFLSRVGKFGGAAGVVLGIGFGAKAVRDARPEDRPRVLAEEGGGVVGGAVGSGLGTLGGAATIAVLGSNPVGWGILLVGAVGGGIVGSEVGREIAGTLYENPILAIPPAAAGMGAPAHTLGAKGGYGNLLCYPGRPGCGRR